MYKYALTFFFLALLAGLFYQPVRLTDFEKDIYNFSENLPESNRVKNRDSITLPKDTVTSDPLLATHPATALW